MSLLTLCLVALILERSIGTRHRSVDLALETVLEFDKPDDVNVINKVQGFLSHVQSLLNKKQGNVNDSTRRRKMYKFTDFLEDVIVTVKSFEDNDFKEVFRIVDKDLRTRRVDNDLIDDSAIAFLSRKLNEIINQPAINIRRNLDNILSELRSDKNKRSSYILDFINTLYKRNSERKLSKLIKRLNLFRRSERKSKVVLKSIIEKGLDDVIYKHYNKLDDNERGYIKKFLRSHLIDDVPTTKALKKKQRHKVTEIIHESMNTEEKTDESKPKEELTTFELTPETLRDVPKETTKKILTHITLYPKTIRTDRVLKFRAGLSTVDLENISIDEASSEDASDNKNDEDIKEADEISTNHSVEINVNLVLKQTKDSQDREDSQTLESIRSKSTPRKVFLRAIKKNSKKHKSYDKSPTPDLSIETFGSLYQKKKPKKYNNKQITRILNYNSKTTLKDVYFNSTYIDDIVKKTSLQEKIHFVGDYRRVNAPTNFSKDRITTSDIKDVGSTRTQRTFITRTLTPLIISTNKVTTPVVTTEKSTTISTQSDGFNEIFDNEDVTKLKVTKVPLIERTNTYIKSVLQENTTQFETDSTNHFNNKTTTEVTAIAFDVNSYIKNSDILNSNDDKKKKQIEAKMKADFGELFDSTPINATTDGFTDIFKDLEDAFQI